MLINLTYLALAMIKILFIALKTYLKIKGNRNIRIIQAMIQIERPTGWDITKIRNLAIEIWRFEIYNSAVNHKLEQTKNRWKF